MTLFYIQNRDIIWFYTFCWILSHYLNLTVFQMLLKPSPLSSLPFFPSFSIRLFWNRIPASLWVIENSRGGFPAMQLFMSSMLRGEMMFLRLKNFRTTELATLSHFQENAMVWWVELNGTNVTLHGELSCSDLDWSLNLKQKCHSTWEYSTFFNKKWPVLSAATSIQAMI